MGIIIISIIINFIIIINQKIIIIIIIIIIIKKTKKHTIIQNEQLSILSAGDHVKITTKHNQIIDGIVYCNIPHRPPLCIIHHYNLERTKNVHVVALNEIRECIKYDEPKRIREVELRALDDEATEKLEKNLAARKESMETLNLSVDNITQELFDFLFRTLPNKCEWESNSIRFCDMTGIIVNEPYQQLTLKENTKKNTKYSICRRSG
eukprot:44719_1